MRLLIVSLPALVLWAAAFAPSAFGQSITNLQQLTQSLSSSPRIIRDVDIEAIVCAASRPKVGVLILQDESGVELLEVGEFEREISPGDRVLIRRQSCLLRKREMGVQISVMPVVNNDGLHGATAQIGEVSLRAGKIPIRLEWFNYWRMSNLEVAWGISNKARQTINASNLWHASVTEPGVTNFLPGLRVECFEGSWETVPDFNLLRPVKEGVVTNFNLAIKSRDERIGIRYSGHLEVPQDGAYRFLVWSDDGALLFVGDQNVPVVSLGRSEAPMPKPSKLLGTGIKNLDYQRWISVEGRVNFASRVGESLELDLGTDQQVITVSLADATGLDTSALVNSRIRVSGLGRGVMTLDQTPVLGRLFAASAKDLVIVERALGQGELELPITSVAQVQNLPIERARKALPVRIRGTVTGAINTSQEHWMSFQDDTRGIFVRLNAVSNAAPAQGELWEVEGHSDAGDFAPIVVADKAARLGEGLLPTPVKPTWTELLNGSRDVQWAELKGLVIDVHTNTVSLQLPEGRLDVELEGGFEPELKPYLKAVIRIRGVLYAAWDAATREVTVGRILMRNSSVSVEVPAPTDPFDAVLKTPRELLLFDAQATAFRLVKVRGQIVYADPTQLFLEDGETGLRLLPVEKTDVRPGDLVEAVGYPGIGRTELLLREAQLRKIGNEPLPPPRKTSEHDLSQENLNLTRVRVEGRLLGWHTEQGSPVLEMQSGSRLFLARMAPGESGPLSIRPGSRLALVGVFVGHMSHQGPNAENESFELLLNSRADLTVLSQPTWWTLPRVLALTGVLVVILIITVVWNTQLRRLVEQRTHQLQHETRERERVERQHALEAERSRIARDLHDDLGSSLTEISVLASTGQHPLTNAGSQPGLFQTIGTKARSLISALDVIVWAVDPEDNSLQSLADYLSGYTNEFFSHTNVSCRFRMPMAFPPITLEGRVRHDLLMVVKEALNNIVRHANSTEVEFRMAVAEGGLEIDIADNGKGIDDGTHNRGHGLKNLSSRLRKLGGSCEVKSQTGKGTSVKIRLPLGVPVAGAASQTD
jgi:signal transduction histidine kinase